MLLFCELDNALHFELFSAILGAVDGVNNFSQIDFHLSAQYEALLRQYPELAGLYSLIKEFHEILFSKKAANLNGWVKKASLFAIPELQTFLGGLNQDCAAVRNAIKYDYNNGLAEGSVTKIKLIKRIMYGRNSFCC